MSIDPGIVATAERARLSAVAEYIRIEPAGHDELSALCELAALVCGVPNAAVTLIDDREQHQVAAFGVDPTICAKDDSMCAVAISGGSDIHVADASSDERFAANPWVDGRLGAVRLYATSLLRSPAGYPVGTLCVFDDKATPLPDHRLAALSKLADRVVDVLELQLRTRELATTVTELARSQEHLAAFAGQVSHDLKTPLTASMGYAELLSELPVVRDDPRASRYAQRCVATGQRMLTMIQELLEFAGVGGRLDRRPVTLDDLMPDVLDDLGDVVDDASVSWMGDQFEGDPTQLRVLLQNLVGNALNYRRPEVRCQVLVEALCTPMGTEVVVSDNGSGIPAERRAEVLRPLARLRTDIPGTGLGLATCARIAASHGGTLHLGDTPGGGLTVTAQLSG
jgi:signal transduction histidine kinase